MTLRKKLAKDNIQPFELDSIVYDASERMAMRVNNEGINNQLEYLEKAGFSEKEILNALNIKS